MATTNKAIMPYRWSIIHASAPLHRPSSQATVLTTISSCRDSFWTSCSDLHSPGATPASLGLDLVMDFGGCLACDSSYVMG